MSSRPAQCSTGIPSAARQTWIKVYATRFWLPDRLLNQVLGGVMLMTDQSSPSGGAKSERVMPSGCPLGHCTSSRR
jgi:hypothetical protein